MNEDGAVEPNKSSRVFTIGHSTLALISFLNLLEKVGITAVADVRSAPFSRRYPHFNREDFQASLKEVGIKYVFLGKELGGRPRAQYLYCDGVADYRKMALEPAFLKGISRVVDGSKEHVIALMCSEHHPLDCHRCLLVGRALSEQKIPISHIMKNGNVVSHFDLERELLAQIGTEEKYANDMFSSRDDLLDIAYRSRARLVAYREPRQESLEPVSQSWSYNVS